MTNAIELLQEAMINKYAVPHFNINNLEWTKYILEECEQLKQPVILGVSESAIDYIGGYNVVYSIVSSLIKDLNITIPVVLHLDHGGSFESCKKAIDAGFTSVMIDASKYELNTNIEITKQVVEYAKSRNVSVEAELGVINNNGIADEKRYTNLEEAITFCKETKIDFLAPSVGSVHGIYNQKPNINIKLIKEISENINIPLVLHGGTGIDDETLKLAVKNGICKININTELQIAWTSSIKNFIDENQNIYDPRKIIKSGEKAIKQTVKNKIELLTK